MQRHQPQLLEGEDANTRVITVRPTMQAQYGLKLQEYTSYETARMRTYKYPKEIEVSQPIKIEKQTVAKVSTKKARLREI